MITKIAYVTRAKMGMKVTGKRMYKSSQLIFLSLLKNNKMMARITSFSGLDARIDGKLCNFEVKFLRLVIISINHKNRKEQNYGNKNIGNFLLDEAD